MTSVVDTSVKHFYSAMQGAPVLSGTAGSLIAVLDACLVTGWGTKAVDSAMISNGVCRLNFASGKSAAEEDAVIWVNGANTDALNGEQKVTAVSSNWVEFKTDQPDGSVSGSLSFKMAPAGWLKAFVGSNLAVYQSLNPQSTKMFVRIDDAGAGSCRLRGYETMTDVNNGAGLFPLDSQLTGGGWMAKSNALNATPVKWRLFANDKSCFLSIVGVSSTSPDADAGRTVFIGDFEASRPGGDAHAFAIGCGTAGVYSNAEGCCDQGSGARHYAARSYTGLGSSVALTTVAEMSSGSTAVSGVDNTYGAFPNPVDGSLLLSRRLVLEGSSPRGVLPGFYTIPQTNVGMLVAPLTKINAPQLMLGRRLMAIGCGTTNLGYPNPNLGISFIDITGPWGR